MVLTFVKSARIFEMEPKMSGGSFYGAGKSRRLRFFLAAIDKNEMDLATSRKRVRGFFIV